MNDNKVTLVPGSEDKVVVASAANVYIVVKGNGSSVKCDKTKCVGFATYGICSHSVAAAHYLHCLPDFVSFFKKSHNQPSLTALGHFGLPTGAGNKDHSSKGKRKRSHPTAKPLRDLSNFIPVRDSFTSRYSSSSVQQPLSAHNFESSHDSSSDSSLNQPICTSVADSSRVILHQSPSTMLTSSDSTSLNQSIHTSVTDSSRVTLHQSPSIMLTSSDSTSLNQSIRTSVADSSRVTFHQSPSIMLTSSDSSSLNQTIHPSVADSSHVTLHQSPSTMLTSSDSTSLNQTIHTSVADSSRVTLHQSPSTMLTSSDSTSLNQTIHTSVADSSRVTLPQSPSTILTPFGSVSLSQSIHATATNSSHVTLHQSPSTILTSTGSRTPPNTMAANPDCMPEHSVVFASSSPNEVSSHTRQLSVKVKCTNHVNQRRSIAVLPVCYKAFSSFHSMVNRVHVTRLCYNYNPFVNNLDLLTNQYLALI